MNRPAFCASCIAERVDLVQRTIDGRRVWVCAECDPEGDRIARRTPPVFRGYQVPERDYAATIREIAKAAPGGATTRDRSVGSALTPGFVLVRVFRLQGGRSIDRDEARETLRDNSWFDELRHVSSERRWHLFERPDVDANAKARRETGYDVAGALSRGGR